MLWEELSRSMRNREAITHLVEKCLKAYKHNDIEYVTPYGEFYFEDMMQFLPVYVALIQLRDNAYKHGSLQKFLVLQANYPNRKTLSLHFTEGNPFEVCLTVESLEDLDLSSVLTVTHFKRIVLEKNRKGPAKKWSDQEVKVAAKSVRSDIGFDYKVTSSKYDNSQGFVIDVKVRESGIEMLALAKAHQEAERIWRRLAQSKCFYIRAGVAGVSSISKGLLAELAEDRNINVLFNLALNEALYSEPKNGKLREMIINKLNRRLKNFDFAKLDAPILLAMKMKNAVEFANANLVMKEAFYQISRKLGEYVQEQDVEDCDPFLGQELINLSTCVKGRE
jgi:hypothetical protein